MKPNVNTIKKLMKSNKISTWEIADSLGVCDNTIFRLFRHEISDTKKKEIEKAIYDILEDRTNRFNIK